MSSKIYRNAIVTLVLTYIWMSYAFFTYLKGDEGFFGRGWDLLIYFLYSMFIGCGLGLVLMILRVFVFNKKRAAKIQSNFFYTFTGIFNLNLFTVFVIATILKLLRFEFDYILFFAMLCFVFSIYILVDLQIAKRNRNFR